MNQLAADFHVCPRTLLRRIKKDTGESPLRYLQNLRINKAKILLESTTLSVSQLTEKVGTWTLEPSAVCSNG
jgi:transcriptional regulator GlxA family with amidase domain